MSEASSTPGSSSERPIVINMPSNSAPATNGGGDEFKHMTPEAFRQRLEQASEAGARKMLKEFGIPKEQRNEIYEQVKSGKYVLAPKPKEGDLDYKSEYEKLKPHAEAAAKLQEKIDKQYKPVFAKMAEEQLAALPESHRKYVAAKVGEKADPEVVLAEIDQMRSFGIIPSGAAPAKEEKPANPATTMAAPGPSAVANTEITPFEHYEKLKKASPTLAARFKQQFGRAIEATRK